MLTWNKMEKDFYTINELAEVLKISRISVFKRVRQGSIIGRKMGRNFVIFKSDVDLKKLSDIIKH